MGSCSKETMGCLVIQVSPSILIFYSIAKLLEKRIGTCYWAFTKGIKNFLQSKSSWIQNGQLLLH